MKVAIGQLVHETNTFSNVRTDQRLFEQWDWSTGDAIREKYTGVRDSLGGMIDGAARQGVELVPTFSAYAYPSGLIIEETYRAAEAEILNGIERAGQLDAICLALHGAAVTEKHEDLESRLLAAVRRVIGTETPLERVMNLGGNRIEMRIPRLDWFPRDLRFPHS
jgi:microcystin degradation protein MlrC